MRSALIVWGLACLIAAACWLIGTRGDGPLEALLGVALIAVGLGLMSRGMKSTDRA